jgi:diaminopimelate epimerase
MKKNEYIITAAGGNGTAIRVIDSPLTRDEYAREGKFFGKKTERLGAEQTGFLIPGKQHLEMAGGEFCGNASRAAAVLLSQLTRKPDVSFTVSGYPGLVQARVNSISNSIYDVACRFDELRFALQSIQLSSGENATIVDLGGIIHVVIEQPLPSSEKAYQSRHAQITRELNLQNRGAVGVLWVERNNEGVIMHPVVWVKDVDTFFYEQSCGSGTIAVAKVTGTSSVRQPTGQYILADIQPNLVILQSTMEVLDVG